MEQNDQQESTNIGYRSWDRDLRGLQMTFQLEIIYIFLIQADNLNTSSNASGET